jgi:hypothetical protein
MTYSRILPERFDIVVKQVVKTSRWRFILALFEDKIEEIIDARTL